MNKKNFLQRMRMPLPELEQYYQMRRAESLEKQIPLQGRQFRRVIHPLLLMCVRARRIISHQKLYVMHDRHTRTNQPVIYACTHIGWSDVEMIFSSIKSHAYLFWGDPCGLYRRVEGFLLDLNGAICML